MKPDWDVIIIGCGPAGMSAAIAAAGQGVSVLVLDRQPEPGGQIFRSAGSAPDEVCRLFGKEYTRGKELIRSFQACGAVFAGGANVWHLTPGFVYYSKDGASQACSARQIIIATGGMERPVPLEGGTLPGVMGVGAVDVLAKSSGLFPDGPVILCGNGPLILQSVWHFKKSGVPVAGVVLTGQASNWLKALLKSPGALLRPAYLAHGARMGMSLLGSLHQCFFSSLPRRISKQDSGFVLEFERGGRPSQVSGQHVLLHEGVVSESQITRLARCRHVWNPLQRYWHAASNIWGQTTVEGIRAIGDCAGVHGADVAMRTGTLAGFDVCRELGVLSLERRDRLVRASLWHTRRMLCMQPFLDRMFAPNPEALQPRDEAVVCRCEELTAKELRETIMAGCYSTDGLKAQARSGMGTCQGRMCSAPVAEMIAQAQGIPLEQLPPYHAQPPLFPLSLGELATMSMPPQGL